VWRSFLPVVLLSLVSCGPRFVKLDPKRIREVMIALVDAPDSVCANAPAWPEVVARIVYDDGERLETRTPRNRHGTLRSTEFAWSAEVGEIDGQGVWRLPGDPLPWHDRTFTVRVMVPGRSDLGDELVVTPRFDCEGGADLAGDAGDTGQTGLAGPRLEVALAYVETNLNGRLILVRAVDVDRQQVRYYLADPDEPSRFVVIADGGAGGQGPAGHDGASGSDGLNGMSGSSGGTCQDGGDGSRGGDGTSGGSGGPGGRGGDGGPGGSIVLVWPAQFPELANRVHLSVDGGDGGDGGPGGRGGRGGKGGQGGSGGSGGSTTDYSGNSCYTSRGSDGADGYDGSNGSDGYGGESGDRGPAGSISARSDSVETLFAAEIARGWKIVLPPAAE
jgi:hypothetical protein